MKKLILVLSFIVFFASPTFANCNYLGKCPQYSPNKIEKASQFFSNTFGTTSLAENFAKNVIEKELKQATNQDFNVDIQAFSLSELIEGKFKSLSIIGNNIVLEGLHLSSLKIQTLCDFNHIDIRKKPLKLKENMVLGFWAEISDEDLRNTLQTKAYLDKLSHISLYDVGIASYEIYPSTININDGNIYATIKGYIRNQILPVDIATAFNINVKDEKVITSKMSFINLFSKFDMSKYTNSISPTKYMNFPINLYGNQEAEVQIVDLSISGNKILLHGMIFLPKTSS